MTFSALPYQIEQNTRLATPNASDPKISCQDSLNSGKTVWFKYTADANRFIIFSTLGSTPKDTFDTIIGVYTGTCGNLVEVSCNDDVDSIIHVRQSRTGILVKPGVTYYILVGEWGGGGYDGGVPTGGNLIFNAYETSAPPIVKGPKTGSVSGGVALSTNNFLTVTEVPPSLPKRKKPNINKRVEKLPPPVNMLKAKASYGSNVIEDRIESFGQSAVSRPVVVNSFEGIPQTNFIPPDPILAVGPHHVMVAVNSTFRIFDKNGTILKTIDADLWFNQVLTGVSTFDPILMYDHFDNRWIFVMLDVNDLTDKSYILLGVSDDEDPQGLWYNWALPSNALGDSTVDNWTDYARVGFDKDAIYITGNQFGFEWGFAYSKLRIIPKPQLYANNSKSVSWKDFWDFRDPNNSYTVIFGLRPSITFGKPGKQFLLNDSPYSIGTYFTLWSLDSALTNPNITGDNIPVVQYYPSPDADQLEGSPIPIEAFGADIRNEPVYRDSALWMVHAVASGETRKYSAVRYVKFDPFQRKALEDVSFGLDGYWHSYPALMINKDGDLVITYSRSSVGEYIGAYLTGRKNNEAPGLAPSILIQDGKGNYVVDFNSGRNRWGDYSGIGLDPSDVTTIWTHTEFAAGRNKWGTWVGKVQLGPVPGTKLTLDRTAVNFGTKNVGTTSDTISITLTNDGQDTLMYSSIGTTSQHFVIASPPTLPLKIPSLGSYTLKVFFQPQAAGSLKDSIVVCPDIACITLSSIVSLSGNGFQVVPAQLGTMYATSGSTDGGKLYSVDTWNGKASFIAPSGVPQITSLRVHPTTKELIALDPTGGVNGAGALYRISASGSSTNKLSNVPVVNPKGMAFVNDSTVYMANFNGNIYTVNIHSGAATLFSQLGLRIGGLALNPVNGSLWISLRATQGSVDAIYKFNFATKTAALVGTTGTGIATSDLLFDKNGKLYGLAGIGFTPNKLIVIDTTTGAGSVVGELGISGMQAIALNPDAVAEIASQKTVLPERYSLEQNYPNPFNPLTTIVFDIPKTTRVILKVYDVLGREIQVLAEGIRLPGRHREYFDATGLASGIYYYQITAGSFTQTKKMTVVK